MSRSSRWIYLQWMAIVSSGHAHDGDHLRGRRDFCAPVDSARSPRGPATRQSASECETSSSASKAIERIEDATKLVSRFCEHCARAHALCLSFAASSSLAASTWTNTCSRQSPGKSRSCILPMFVLALLAALLRMTRICGELHARLQAAFSLPRANPELFPVN